MFICKKKKKKKNWIELNCGDFWLAASNIWVNQSKVSPQKLSEIDDFFLLKIHQQFTFNKVIAILK